MKLITGFFRLIRFSNLLFIVVTQLLFYFCIVQPLVQANFGARLTTSPGVFLHLLLASVLIAAGGYIINDYFDLNIDRVNKPDKLVVEKLIRRRWAIIWHILFSIAGLAISFYVGYLLRNPLIGFLNLLAVLLLWFYSTTFKKQLVIGNVIISLLTAWVVMILYVCEIRFNILNLEAAQVSYLSSLFKVGVLYGGFAFVISLVREVVKDIEDMEGDARHHCRTMPIVWGVQSAKTFAYTWLTVLTAAVLIFSVYTIQIHWFWMTLYLIVAVMIPLVLVFQKLGMAVQTKDFSGISRLIKWIMLTGILSMVFFKIYI